MSHIEFHELDQSAKRFIAGLHALVRAAIKEDVHGPHVSIPWTVAMKRLQAVLLGEESGKANEHSSQKAPLLHQIRYNFLPR